MTRLIIPALVALLGFLAFPGGQLFSMAKDATDAQKPFITGDGLSFETAIHFPSLSNRDEVVMLEYWFLEEIGQTSLGQMLVDKDGISYDAHETENGEIYFCLPPQE
jgi:hypothetical protein